MMCPGGMVAGLGAGLPSGAECGWPDGKRAKRPKATLPDSHTLCAGRAGTSLPRREERAGYFSSWTHTGRVRREDGAQAGHQSPGSGTWWRANPCTSCPRGMASLAGTLHQRWMGGAPFSRARITRASAVSDGFSPTGRTWDFRGVSTAVVLYSS